MKCTQCGNEKLVKTSIPMENYGDGWSKISEKDVDVYLCVNCGHYELFSMKKVKDYENLVSQISEKRKLFEDLEKELSVVNNKENQETLKNRISTIKKQLNSLDITIRQQQELKNELRELELKEQSLPSSISFTEKRVREIRQDIQCMEDRLQNGEF